MFNFVILPESYKYDLISHRPSPIIIPYLDPYAHLPDQPTFSPTFYVQVYLNKLCSTLDGFNCR